MKKYKIMLFSMLLLGLTGTCILASCNTADTTPSTDTADTSADTSATADSTDLSSLEKVELVDGAIYAIKTSDPEYEGYALTVENYGTTDNSYVKLELFGKEFSQLWRVKKNDDGTYTFENMASLMHMTLRNPDSYKKEKKLSVSVEGTNDVAKKWNVYTTDGTAANCVIQNVYTSNAVTTTYVKSSKILFSEQTKYEANANQKWTFQKVSDGNGEYPYLLVLSGDYKGSSSCPEILYYDGVYYNYNMTGPITLKTSTDLTNWTIHPDQYAFKNGRPSWLQSVSGGTAIWAPGAYKIGDKYFLYYCTSSSGSQNSGIGVAVTDDPSKNDWTDNGLVIRSYHGVSNFNAIDPNVFVDDDGTAYLVYGSYWDGVFMRKLDPETGKFDENDTMTYHLAQGNGEFEAPYLINEQVR